MASPAKSGGTASLKSEGPRKSEVEHLREADVEITAALKGPMSNLERALLVADRKDIRAALAKAEGRS